MNKNVLIIIAICIPFIGYILFSDSFNDQNELIDENTQETETNQQNPVNDEDVIDKHLFKTATDSKSGIVFEYPTDVDYQYVRFQKWPPRFVNSTDPIKCELDEQTQAMSGATSSNMTYKGNTYCIWKTSEGAAGSTYVTYQVIYPKENQFLTMSFTLQYPQCENYPTEEVSQCEAEQDNFPINNLTDRVAQSATLPN